MGGTGNEEIVRRWAAYDGLGGDHCRRTIIPVTYAGDRRPWVMLASGSGFPEA